MAFSGFAGRVATTVVGRCELNSVEAQRTNLKASSWQDLAGDTLEEVTAAAERSIDGI